MKIVIISFDEPFFIADLFKPLLEQFAESIKAVIIVPPKHPKKSRMEFILEQSKLIGLAALFTMSAKYLKEIILTKLGFSERSIATIARKNKIKVISAESANSKITKDYLRRIRPDIVLTQVPEVIDKSVLKLAKKGFINKHASLLPKYKGLYPVFWALLKGEKKVGYTFHLMSSKVDSGDILFQKSIKVLKEDSLNTLYQKIFKLAGEDLPGVVENFGKNVLTPKKMPKVKNQYFSQPKNNDIKRFKKLGYRLS